MPARTRRQQRSPSSQTGTGARDSGRRGQGRGNAARAAAVGQGGDERRGLWGWFQDAGQWVGDRATDAADAVKGAVQQTAETVGDVWDVARSSDVDVDWSARQVTVETDLDEVMDLVPPELAAALQFDRAAAENRISAVYDHRAGRVTLTSPVLALSGVQTERLQTGAVSLRDVRIVLSNQGEGLPFAREDAGVPRWQGGGQSLVADLTVGGLDATNVVFAGPDGPVTVAQLQLQDLSGAATDTEGALGGEGTIAGFSVSSAILGGLRSQGVAVDRLEATDVSTGLTDPGEAAFLAAGSVTATGASRGDEQLGNATLRGARVDVQSGGGGMPFFDQQPDRLTGTVRADAASIQDFDGASADVASASMAGLSGTFGGGSAQVRAADIQASGVDTATADVQHLDLDDASARIQMGASGPTTQAAAASATATGVSTNGFSARHLSTSGLSADLGPGTVGVGADRISLGGAQIGADVTLDEATILGASAGRTDGRSRLTATEASASGARFRDTMSADRLSLAGFDAQHGADGATVAAASLGAEGVQSRDGSVTGSVSSVSARDSRARFHADGTIDGGADRIVVEGARHGDVVAGRGEARGLQVRHAAGATDVRASGIAIDDFDSAWTQAGRLQGTDAAASLDATRMSASLGSATLTDAVVADRVALDRADVTGLTAHRGGGAGGASLQQATLTGLRDQVTGSGASSATVTDLTAASRGRSIDARLARLDATDVRAGDASAASLTATTGRALWDGTDLRSGFNHTTLQDGRLGESGQLDSASITGLTLGSSGGGVDAGFQSADATGLRYAAGGTSAAASSLHAHGASLRSDAEGLRGGLDQLRVSDASAQVAPGGGSGSGGADMGQLIRTASARVDDASLRASLPMGAGQLGPVSVAPDTRIDAQVGVRDGQFVSDQTRATFSRPLDGPAWTSASGIYMTDRDRLKADVNGWFDQDIGGTFNEALGLPGKRVPDVQTLGAAVAAGRGSGGSGGGSSDLSAPVDLSSAQARGSVSLSQGTIDAGGAGSATLGRRERGGDNTFGVQYSGASGLQVQSDRVLLDGAAGSGGSAGRTEVSDLDARVAADGTVRGSAAQIDARDLRFGN